MEKDKFKKVTVHNKILPTYRSVHVDGAYGGITSRGLINISLFAERSPIPKSSVFQITEENQIGDFVKHSSESKEGIIREFEVGFYMDINIAKALNNLLSAKISEYETMSNITNETK